MQLQCAASVLCNSQQWLCIATYADTAHSKCRPDRPELKLQLLVAVWQTQVKTSLHLFEAPCVTRKPTAAAQSKTEAAPVCGRCARAACQVLHMQIHQCTS